MRRVIKDARLTPHVYQLRPPAPLLEPIPPPVVPRPAIAELPQAHADALYLDGIRAAAERIVDEASSQAQGILEAARSRAVLLVEDAERRTASIEEQAKQSGFQSGVSQGRESVQTEMDEMLATMRGLVEMARAERRKIIEAAEPELVRLSVAIAERILGAHVALEPAAVLEMVKSAITRLVNREKVTVRVNPADIETMREHRDRLMAMNDIDNLRLIEDQRVDRGGVVIETDAGTIDSKVSTQLREVRRLLAVDETLSVPPASGPALIVPPAQAS